MATALLFSNGHAAYCDDAGEQIPDLQRHDWRGLGPFLARFPGGVVRLQGSGELTPEASRRLASQLAPPAGPAERFRELLGQWRKRPLTSSWKSEIVNHPAYRTVIAEAKLDPVAWLPLILREYEAHPEPWHAALEEVAGESPVAPAEKGQPELVREAWLRWGREKGHLPPAREPLTGAES